MTLPFDHTHDLDLEFSSSTFEIALFEEWEACELIIHDHDIWVIIVGWVDVLGSDRGDLRHGRAVDISSHYYISFV